MATIPRTIVFFRLIPFDKKERENISRKNVLAAINAINPSKPKNSITFESVGERICLWSDNKAPAHGTSLNHVKFSLIKVREKQIPGTVVWETAKRANLDVPNVFEPMHVVMFDQEVLGIEWNQYGTRPNMIARYFAEICKLPSCYLKQLYDADVMETLNGMENLSLLTFDLPAEKVSLLNNSSGRLSQGLNNILNPYPTTEVSLTIKAKEPPPLSRKKDEANKQRVQRQKYSEQLSHAIFEEVRNIVGDADSVDAMNTFKVKGYDPATKSTRTLDLLEERIHARKDVELSTEQSGLVHTEAMYKAIIKAYDERVETIKRAIRARGL